MDGQDSISGVWREAISIIRRYPATGICKEDRGPVESLGRSNGLVRGRFWFVFGTATVAFFSEEAIIHAGALTSGSITGSHTWGEWIGGSIVASLVIPLSALTTSLAYSRVANLARLIKGS